MSKFNPNTLYYVDGYKISHKDMLADNTDYLYGTWIPRSLKYIDSSITKVVSFGQQLAIRWLHDEFQENFFELSQKKAMQFGKDITMYLGMEYDAEHFRALHNLGYLPIKVKSLPEGIETPANVPHMTFINTEPGFAWLTLYLETIISSLSWKSSTSATLALEFKRRATKAVMDTDKENAWFIDFACHDFSSRGLDPFSMLASGLGHASSFRGSDTVITIPGARYFYGESEDEVIINSVNASEHSVSTTKIFTVGEKQMIIDWCKKFPKGILSVVADTFDLWKLITEYLTDPEVKEAILARDGKLVIRPDSGDPVDITCGYPEYEVYIEGDDPYTNPNEEFLMENEFFTLEGKLYQSLQDQIKDLRDEDGRRIGLWEMGNLSEFTVEIPNKESACKGVIELLWDIFGGTVNEQGYKVLDSHIGAIYGDSINLDRQSAIYSRLKAKNFAATNIVLGVGSFTYQFNTRDTLGFAAKGAWFEADGKGYDIYKEPITDDGTKKSLKGRIKVNEDLTVSQQVTKEEEEEGMLKEIYNEGTFTNSITFTQIRNKINENL